MHVMLPGGQVGYAPLMHRSSISDAPDGSTCHGVPPLLGVVRSVAAAWVAAATCKVMLSARGCVQCVP